MEDQPTTTDEDQAWRDAHAIAWIGASNPRAVQNAVDRWTNVLGTDHLAVRAMVDHLDFLNGHGLGPDPEVLDAVVDNARRLGLITDRVALRVTEPLWSADECARQGHSPADHIDPGEVAQ